MTYNEFLVLVKGMKAVYGEPWFLPDKDAIGVWYNLLQDIPYQVCSLAIQKYMSTNKKPPTIADIRELASTTKNGDIDDWGKGWEQVERAIRIYGMWNIDKAMDSFDEITRECVKRLGFQNICMSGNQNLDRANFRMIYEELANRKKRDMQVSESVKLRIAEVQNDKLRIGEDICEKR